MSSFVFDLEVFINMFSATFLDLDTQEKYVFYIYENQNDGEKLKLFLENEYVLFGYNNLSYDGPVLDYALENYWNDNFLKKAFEFSSNLIDKPFGTMRYKYTRDHSYRHVDLMKIIAGDKLGISLKQLAITLRWPRIMDLPYAPTHKIQSYEVGTVLDYNLNDVLITQRLHETLLPQIELRERLGILYGVDLSSASDSKIANIVIEDYYTKLGEDVNRLRSLRTPRFQIMLSECFGKNIEFKTNRLNRVKNEIGVTVVRENNEFKFSKKIEFGGKEYDFGVGGIHTVDEEGVFETDKDYIIRDADVASFYPNIIINNKLIPEHLDDKFITILEQMTKERVTAKKKDKIKAESLKIAVNSCFGKTGSTTFFLYDPKVFLSVTISGQLYLLMLIENLVLAGIPVISANTDGIVCKIPRLLENKYREVCDWWQNKTGFVLEFSDYAIYARADVNNYITKKINGEIKSKGRFVVETNLQKAYKHPIVQKALYNYFIHNQPVEQSIRGCNDILEFCIAQKMDKKFVLEYRVNDVATDLQKTNRFYISIGGGTLVKRNTETGRFAGLYVGKTTRLLNDYDPSVPFQSYQVDFAFYIEEAQKYIDEIEKSRYNENDYTFIDDAPDFSPVKTENPAKDAIVETVRGIKNLNEKTLNALAELENFTGTDWLEFLIFAEDNNYLHKKFGDLIKINYFSKFGPNKKLSEFFQEFTCGKLKYTSTLSPKTKTDRVAGLRWIWLGLKDDRYTVKEQIDSELAILGKIRSSFNVGKRYAYVINVDTRYSPRLHLFSLGSGSQAEVRLQKRYYDINPILKGDIIYTESFEKKPAVRWTDEGRFVPDPTRPDVFWLTGFRHVRDYSELDKKAEKQ